VQSFQSKPFANHEISRGTYGPPPTKIFLLCCSPKNLAIEQTRLRNFIPISTKMFFLITYFVSFFIRRPQENMRLLVGPLRTIRIFLKAHRKFIFKVVLVVVLLLFILLFFYAMPVSE